MRALTDFRTLGRSGLKVSPLAFGAMTFGWGADKETSRRLLARYLERGGNFVDTADLYANGASEEWLGEMLAENGARDRVVLATKFGFGATPGDPNAGGNGRKRIRKAIEGSLKRLRTDRVDLYILHVWDRVTPVEEVAATLDDLVREGKVLHPGISNAPAWVASRWVTLADLRGWARPVSLQLEYSLVSRSLEREHVPLAQELGLSVTPWSPLASGFLTGKFRREGGTIKGIGRVADMKDSGNPTIEKFSKRERNWTILETLLRVSETVGLAPATVALAWVMSRPCVASTLIGATREAQLDATLGVLEASIPPEALRELDEASRPEPNELDDFFGGTMQGMVTGGTTVTRGV